MIKKKKEILIFINFLFILFPLWNCTESTKNNSQNMPFELKVKNQLMNNHVPKKNWIKLEVRKSKPNENDIVSGMHLMNPSDLNMDKSGYIYCVDNILSTIYRLDNNGNFIDSFGKKGQGPGELNFPLLMEISNDRKIFVYQGTKVSIFHPDGLFLTSIKIFKQFHDLLIAGSTIYANCSYNDNDKHFLIETFSEDGNVLNAFGERLNIQGHWNRDGLVYLDKLESNLVTAFKHHPLVRIYSKSGDLIKEFGINLDIMRELEKLNFDQDYNNMKPSENPIPRLPRIIAGIKSYKNNIYILLHLPRIEILQYSSDGTLLNHYYSDDLKNILNYGNGFIVYNKKEAIRFGIIESVNAKIHFFEPIK